MLLTVLDRSIEPASLLDLKTLRGIIYAIVNGYDGKIYIGQSKMTFHKRYGKSWWRTTSNVLLQRTLQYADPEDFSIYILEHSIGEPELLNEREKLYANALNSYAPRGYNLRECGSDNFKMICPQSQEKLRRGKESTRKTYRVRHIESGTEIEIKYVKGWCEQNKIIEKPFRQMLCKRCATTQGYALATTDISKIDKGGKWMLEGKSFTVRKISTGELITFNNSHRFARENGLRLRGFSCMLHGASRTSQGYCLPETVIPPSRIYQVTSPDGIDMQFADRSRFEQEHSISLQHMARRGGKNKQGWSNLFVFQEGRIVRGRENKPRPTQAASSHNPNETTNCPT